MKISFKLNQYIFFILVIILFSLVVVFLTQYYFSSKNITQNFTNKIYKDTLHVREHFRLVFDKIQYDFRQKKLENIDKLDFALEYIDKNKNYSIEKLEKELNKNVSFGKYEVFIINKNYVIENASYKPDIGLDFKAFKTIKNLFNSIFNKEIIIDISPPKMDSASMNLKRYLVKLSKDESKLIQVAYVLNSYKTIKERYNSIKYLADDIKLSLATRYSLQKIDLNSDSFEKYTLEEDWAHTVDTLKAISLNLPEYKKEITQIINTDVREKNFRLNNELSKIFKDENKLLVSIQKENSYVYSITNGLFNRKDETKLFIKTTFSNKSLKEEKSQNFFSLLYIYMFIVLILIFVYKFILKNVSSKLLNIIKDINNNKKSDEKNIIVKEIENLKNDYNKLHDRLNTEVNKNQLLLSQNKEFIADMVHQIRTPLSVIMTNTNLIEMTQKDKNSKEFINSINSSINMLSNSYEDLSFVISNDSVEYKPSMISISKLLKNRCEFFSSIAYSRKREIHEKIESNINFFINEIELERMIDNNLTNCIKYSNPNTIIEVILKKNKEVVELIFISKGEEINNTEKLFDRYYRENNSQRGSGIGLNIVKNVCNKYNISIGISSKNQTNIFIYTFNI